MALTAPGLPLLTPVGGNVVANTLNATNTNLQIQALIVAGEATGGSADFYIGATNIGTDSSISAVDSTVTFDTSDGTPTTPELQAAVATGGLVTVVLRNGVDPDATSASTTLTVDYTAPGAVSAPVEQGTSKLADGKLADGKLDIAEYSTSTIFRVSLGSSQAVAGDTVELLLGNAPFGTAKTKTLVASDVTSGFVEFTVSSADLGADGSKSLSARVTDAAGNVGANSSSLTFVLDSKPAFTAINGEPMPATNSRATPVSTIGFTLGAATIPVFADVELFYSPSSSGASAVRPLPGTYTPAPVIDGSGTSWQIKNLSEATKDPGAYILTYSKDGVTFSYTWVMTYSTAGELTATPTLQPSEVLPQPSSPRGTPVDTVKFVFSEDVTGVDVQKTGTAITQFELRQGGVKVAFPTGATVTGGGNTYFLNGLSTVTGSDGSYQVLLAADPAIKTLAGGQLIAPVSVAWEFRTKAAATITLPAGKTYKVGDILTVTAAFSDTVYVAGTPTIGFTLGTIPKQFAYVGGSGTKSLQFQYTVVSGDIDTDGVQLTNSIALPSVTTLKDAYSRDANPLFGFVDASGIKIDGEVPTASPVAPSSQVYKTGDKITFVVPFSESVVVGGNPTIEFALGVPAGAATRQANLTAASKTASGTSPGAQTLTFEYTVDASDSSASGITISKLNLNGGTIQDAAGNNANLTFSAVPVPGVVINRTGITSLAAPADKIYKSGDVLEFTATFSSVVTVTGTPRIQFLVDSSGVAKNATYVSGNGTTTLRFRYSVVAGDVDINGIDLTSALIDLNGGTIKDASNTDAALSFAMPTTTGVLVDGVAPTVAGVTTPVASAYVTGNKLAFAVTFSEIVNVTGAPKLLVTIGGTSRQVDLASTSGTGTSTLNFEYPIVTGDASITGVTVTGISLAGGTIKDAAGNDATLASGLFPAASAAFAVNRTGITSLAAPADKTYKAGDVLEFTATFSNVVTVTGTPRIQFLVDSSGAAKNATYVAGNGTTTLRFRYMVVAGDLDLNGIDLTSALIDLNSGTIVDASSTAAALSFAIPSTSGVRVDGVAPTISGVTTPAASAYVTGNKLTFAVTFSEVVNVTGAPKLLVTIGGTTRQVDLASTSGTGTSTLNFEYPIVAGDSSITGVTVTGISLAGGTIKDAAGNDATLASGLFPAASAAFAVNRTGITSFAAPADKTYKAGDVLEFTATFSNVVTVTGTPRIQFLLDSSGAAKNATYVAGNGTTTLRFRYMVVAGDLDPNGIDLTSALIDLNSGTIVDASSTAAALSFAMPSTSSVLVDGVAPKLQAVAVPSGSPAGFAFSDFSSTKNLQLNGAAVASSDIITLTPSAGGTGSAWYTTAVGVAGDFETRFRFRIFNTTPSTGDGIAFVIQNQGSSALGGLGGSLGYSGIPNGLAIEFDTVRNTTAAHGFLIDDPDANHISIQSRGASPLSSDHAYSLAATSAIPDFSDDVVHDVLLRYSSGTLSIFLDNFHSPVLSYAVDLRSYLGLSDGTAFVGFTAATGANVSKHEIYNWSFTSASLASTIGFGGRGYTTGDALSFTATFDEPVVVTGLPQLALTLGSATRQAVLTPESAAAAATLPGTRSLVFVYTVAADDSSTAGVSVNAISLNGGSIKDAAGNTASISVTPVLSDAFTVNRAGITSVAVTPKTYKLGEPVDFVVNFSSPVFVSGIPRIQFLLDASSVSKAATFISGNGSSALRFRYVVAASDFDVTGIDVANAFVDLNGGAIKDAFNSAAAVSFTQPTTAGVLIDGVAPTISGVTTPSASAYITGNKLTFAVTFSEVVNVAGAPKLLVTIGGATRQVDLASTSGTGTSTLNFEYPIVAGDSSITGVTVTGISLAGGTIKDAAGNDATLASGLIPAASAAFAVNRTTITSFAAPADKTYKAGDVLEFTATFSNVVTVTGVPRIQFLVDSSSAAKNATYVSGNGTTTLRFRYTVVAGDLDTSGIDLTSAQIDLNGGTITDSVSTPVLTFPVPNLTAVLVDGVAPRAFSTINGPIPGTYVKGIAGQDTLTFTVPFDDVVTVAGSGTPTLQFTLGANVRQATFVGAAGFTGNSLEFRYTVQTGDYATSASIAANPINLNGATIRDANGNDASLAILPQAYSGVIVNVTSVTQVAVASPANRYYRAGDTILLAATFDAPVTVTGTPTIALSFSGNAPAAKDSRYVSGSGTKTLTFAYTVVDGDLDLDGVQFGFPTITLPVGTAITNTGGNVLLAFVPPDISGIRVDAVVPTRVGVTVPPAGNYKAGDTLQLTVSFNESVQVMPEAGTGNVPRIALVVGSRTRYASYVAGTETPVLVFDYVVANDDVDTNGIVVGTAILLNGGFITDIAGNTGSLVINPGPTNAVLVDGVAPTISRFAVPLSTKNGSYRAGTSIPITATMSKPVVAGSTLDVVLDTSAVVTLTAATTGTTLSGTYVVEAGQNSPDLDVVGIFNANVADAFGNLLASTALPIAGNSIAGSRAIVVDTITPAPVGISLGTGVGDGATAAEATQAAGVVTVTGESGATITVTFTRGANTVTKTLTGTGGAQAVVLVAGDVTTLGNGLVNVSATQADAAGNTSTAATSSFTIDTVAPNAPTLALGTGVSNGATLAEATQASGVVTVTGESGAAIVVTFTGALGTVTRNVTGTGSSQAVSLTAGDVATLGNGTVSVAASQTDAAGNPQTAAPATASFAIDTAAPAAATLVLGPGVTAPVSRAEALQAAGVVVVTGELGATVTVTFTQGANTVTKTLTGTGGAQAVVLTAGDLSSLGDGAVTVAASQTDAAGNLQTAAVNTLSFTLDTAVPNAVTVALGSGVSGGVTSAEALQASGVVTVTGESGAAITVVFTRGVNTVTKTLTGSGAVQAVVLQAGDLTALGDGVVNVSVTQADAAGNVSTAATTSFTLDTAAPSAAVLALGPGVTAPVSRSEALQAAGVVTVSGEVGAAITVTFTQGVNTVTKTFTGTGSAQPVVLTTSDLITLGDGAVTVSASQTDVAGNVQSGAANTLSFNLDTAVPNPVAITLGTGVGDGATAAEATQAAGVVTVTGESGATINVTFTRGANTVTKTLTGTGGVQAVVLLAGDVTTLGNGLVNVSATQADATGNTSTAATGSFTIDTVAPNAPTLALGTGVSNGATLAEATQASGVVTVTGESGAAIAVTFTGALGTVTRNVTGTGSSQAVALTAGDVATLGNGTVSVAASQTDAAGNPQTAAPATASFTLDTAAPAAATLVLGPGITDPVSRSEALQAAGIVTVTGEAGAAITVTFTRAGNTITKNLTGTGSAQAVTLTASDLTTLGDGVVVISAVQSDAAGNQQTAVAASVSFSLDTAAPAAATLVLGPGVSSPVSRSEATQAAGVVTATGENGASLVVTFARGAATVTKTLTGMGLAQAVVLTTADLTTLGDGLVSVSASQTDAAGNVQAAAASSLSFVLDAAAPNAVAIVLGNGVSNGATAAEATQASGAVVVTGESGAEITVAFTRGANTVTKTLVGTGSAQPVVLTTSDLTALGDGAVTVSASQTDAAGNQQTAVPATVSFTLDRAAPNTPVLVLGPGVTNPVSMGEATQASGVVTVTGENGAAITVTFTRGASTVSKSLTGTGGVQPIVLTAAEVTSLGSGSVAVSVAQADAAGNQSATASLSFSLDPVAPNAAIIALGAGVADGATAAEATQASGVVTVTGEIGAAITVVFTRGVTTVTKTLTGTGSGQPVILTTADLTALGDGAVTVSVSQADAAGNPQTGLASTVSFTLDTVTPTVSALTSAVPNGTYRVGNTVQIALNYSEPVFVTGVPTIPLNISPTRSASYVSGSGTNQLLFTYTVGTGDTASRLNNASSSLDGTGIQLRDAAGNGVSLALPGPTAGGALASSSDIVIDGAIRITATGFGTTAATATVFNRSVTSIPIRFNVPVTGVSLQSFRLFYENRSVSLAGAVIRGSGTNWTLTLPAKATSLRGNYRLAVGGAGSGIQSNGVAMNAASRLHWRRV